MADRLRAGVRLEVVWIGAPNSEVVGALQRRKLLVRSLDVDAVVVWPKTATRAVVVSASADLRENLGKLFLPILDSGAALFVVLPTKEKAESDLVQANHAIGTLKRVDKDKAYEVRQPIKTLSAWLPEEFAEACAGHDPGPPENTALTIDSETAEEIAPSHRRLLTRAFQEFERIRLTSQGGGFSGAKVWKVEAYRAGGHSCEPFVVKAGEWNRIVPEIERIRDFVQNYVPFPNYAPVEPDRSVEGATDALIVSMFVDRAVRMDEYLGEGSPRLVITSLFDGPLRRWRTNRIAAPNVELGDVYRRFGVIPDLERSAEYLQEAYQLAVSLRAGVRQPHDLVDALLHLPLLDVVLAYAHGDLHLKNMYVKRNSIDVVLIDFAHTGQESPLSRDPAALDVSLAFDQIKGLTPLTADSLREIYTAPLLPPDPGSIIDNRTEAIHQVRVQALGDGVRVGEYEISVACYLLRLCRFPDIRERRGLAYDLADLLVASAAEAGAGHGV